MTFDIYTKLSLNEKQKKFIILNFAKELIKNSGEYLYTLEKVVKDKEIQIRKENEKKFSIVKRFEEEKDNINNPEVKEEKKTELQESEGGISDVVKQLEEEKFEISMKPLAAPRERLLPSLEKARLRIPEPILPPQFSYLKPTPSERQIALGKLDALIKDPLVKAIECAGPNQNIIVTQQNAAKKTNIILSREEIDEVVEKFSKAAKIPITEGVFRVVIGRLVFLAIISEVIGSRFIIKKMIYNSVPQRKHM